LTTKPKNGTIDLHDSQTKQIQNSNPYRRFIFIESGVRPLALAMGIIDWRELYVNWYGTDVPFTFVTRKPQTLD